MLKKHLKSQEEVAEVEEEEVEEEAEVTSSPLSTREVEDKMPNKLSRRPMTTSQHYEHDDLLKIIKRVG